MRVLLVSQEFPPETGWGGIGTYLGVLAPALVRAGAEVHVLSVVEGQPHGDRIVDGVHVHRAPFRRPPGVGRALRLPLTWRRVSLAVAVSREVRRLRTRFDVCETPEWGAEGLMLALRRALPLVVRLHSGASQIFPYVGPIGRDRRWAIRYEEALVRRANVVTGTRAQTSTVARELDLDPEGVRTITCPIAPVDPLAATNGSPRVLFAGRFEARKGPDVLLRAVPRLLERVPDVRVVLRGTDTGSADGGSYSEQLRRLVTELGIAKITEIVDRWDVDAVREELPRATVCAVPSRWESFGYVAAEAAALGSPVVASRIPALEDIVTDGVTGRLVPTDDPASLSDALGDLLSEPSTARRMGAEAAREIAERCDPDRVAALTLEAYALAITRWET
jgi:glycosyltransferase involved in cell wall biosynthesis